MKLFDLSGKVALITGGSRGIGRATCLALARQGAYVVINYVSNVAAADETLAAVRAEGGDGEVMPFNVADADAVGKAVDDVNTRKQGLHIAVANAGVAIDGLLLRLKDADVDQMLSVNVKGALYLAKSVTRVMLRQKYGRVIFISSVVGESGNVGQVGYAASKGALLSIAKSLAKEYGSRNVTYNCVTPGFIATDMTAKISDAMRQNILDMTPVGRLGTPEEVAASVAYLASAEAGFVTGTALRINGGLYV